MIRSIKELKLALGLIGACTSEPSELTLEQRAQTDPAGLLGARFMSKWVDETYACEALMIREAAGEEKKFQALVRYDFDQKEQWETIGAPPFCHQLISEPAETWLRTGSELIGSRTMVEHNGKRLTGTVMCWLPETDDNATLFKIYYCDGDYEELELAEVKESIALFESARQVGE